MKTCIVCGKEKPETAFEKHRYGRRNQCHSCRHRQKIDGGVGPQQRVYVSQARRIRDRVTEHKRQQGCQHCRQEWEPIALDLHHLDPGTKDSAINTLVRNKASRVRLDAELAKCVVLCANCHRKLHAGLWALTEEP